jgi:hypothetical protein
MKPLHEGLHITDSDWTEFMKIITGTLVELKLPQQEQRDWAALFEKTFRPDPTRASRGHAADRAKRRHRGR